MWKYVRDRAVRDISEERDIVGLELSLECHPCAMTMFWACSVKI